MRNREKIDGKKTILILGAGLMQAPAINAAHKLNCNVIAVDANPHAISAKLADEFYPIDLKDIPALIDLAKKLRSENKLDGVFTAATDFSFSVASIATACNLPGHTVNAAFCASNKIKMRECFAKHSVPSPKFIKIKTEDINNAIHILNKNKINFPITVKPSDNMGARGCRLVHCKAELAESLKNAVFYSGTNTAIAEEFIDGEEFSLEALVINREIYITAIADRHIFFPPYFVEMGHTIPSNHSDDEIQELVRVFKLGIKAIGLTNGAAKGDIFLRKTDKTGKRSACIGEIAARLSGGYMSGWTVPYSSGLNVTEEAVKIALGYSHTEKELKKLENLNFNKIGFSAERAWISIPGKVKKIYGNEDAKKEQYVKDVLIRNFEKDSVIFPKNNIEKCGNVLSSAPSYKAAVTAGTNAIKKIVLRLEKNNHATDNFLKNMHLKLEDQNMYEPNFFTLPPSCSISCKENIDTILKKSCMEKSENLYFPSCFKNILADTIDPNHRSMEETLQLAFKIEPELPKFIKRIQADNKFLSEQSINLWKYFIRGSIQGLLYFYDSFK